MHTCRRFVAMHAMLCEQCNMLSVCMCVCVCCCVLDNSIPLNSHLPLCVTSGARSFNKKNTHASLTGPPSRALHALSNRSDKRLRPVSVCPLRSVVAVESARQQHTIHYMVSVFVVVVPVRVPLKRAHQTRRGVHPIGRCWCGRRNWLRYILCVGAAAARISAAPTRSTHCSIVNQMVAGRMPALDEKTPEVAHTRTHTLINYYSNLRDDDWRRRRRRRRRTHAHAIGQRRQPAANVVDAMTTRCRWYIDNDYILQLCGVCMRSESAVCIVRWPPFVWVRIVYTRVASRAIIINTSVPFVENRYARSAPDECSRCVCLLSLGFNQESCRSAVRRIRRRDEIRRSTRSGRSFLWVRSHDTIFQKF